MPRDAELEKSLRAAVARELKEITERAERGGDRKPTPLDQRMAGRSIALRELEAWTSAAIASGQIPLTGPEEVELVDRVLEWVFTGTVGFEELLSRPDVTDIFVNGWDDVRVWRADGAEERVEPFVTSDEALVDLVRQLAARHGHQEREWTTARPILDLQLQAGYRLAAAGFGVAARPYVTIRRYLSLDMTLDDLVERGALDPGLRSLFEAMVAARKNLVICGGQGTGKTTLLRALLFCCEPDERIVVIEDEPELQLAESTHLDHVVSLYGRSPNSEGAGGVTLADLSRASKRHQPRRVVVGEVRGEEVVDMFEAMSQGIRGSMCTIHADTAHGLFERLPSYAKTYPVDRLMGLAALALDFVVVLGLDDERRRVVREVLLVDSYDADVQRPRSHQLFVPDPHTGRAARNPTSPMPAGLLDELAGFGYDPALHPSAGLEPAWTGGNGRWR